ncbi:hypothetical protein D9611_014157 [Ephemerocybe angulata]|uniref:F-box domain-containing protein n=1 Tax=Ephemerocybe angulata TaxID=980116 RepID=A0A8H5FF91_9AGAR|nr:hypothetical protein D9611_014157 [Tulosesus angulatus]
MELAVDHLVSSNVAPSALEAASAKQAIQDLEQKADHHRLQLESVQAKLHQHTPFSCPLRRIPFVKESSDGSLEQKAAYHQFHLKSIAAKLDQYKRILSPIRRIPPEVLGEIFLRVPETIYGGQNQKTLATISLVCATWRDAAIVTTELWSILEIDPTTGQTVPYDAAATWLSRAGSVPKMLCLYAKQRCRPPNDKESLNQDGCCGDECGYSDPLLADLLLRGPSLNDLVLGFYSPRCFQRLLESLGATNAPIQSAMWNSIKEFTFHCRCFDDSWVKVSPSFQFLPTSLGHLHLYLPRLYNSPDELEPLNIPTSILERLVHFQVTNGGLLGTRLLEDVQHCVKLERLQLDSGGYGFEWSVPDPSMESLAANGLFLPNLTALELRQLSSFDLPVLQYLKMPKIAEITLTLGPEENNDYDYEEGAAEGIHSNEARYLALFLGAQGTLRSLTIEGPDFLDNSLFDILGDLQSLHTLVLKSCWIENDPFGTLLQSPAPKYLPRLKELRLLRHRGLDLLDQHRLWSLGSRRGIQIEIS